MKILKSKGPKTEPCGTPLYIYISKFVIYNGSLISIRQVTFKFSGNPQVFKFARSGSWLSVSNALKR